MAIKPEGLRQIDASALIDRIESARRANAARERSISQGAETTGQNEFDSHVTINSSNMSTVHEHMERLKERDKSFSLMRKVKANKGDQATGAPFDWSSSHAVKRTVDAAAKKGKTSGKLTRADFALIEVAADIATNPIPEWDDWAYYHAILCQVGFPRSQVEGLQFMRQSGEAWVSLQAGVLDEGKGPVQQPIPYGVLPRLAMGWISTFAVRNKQREIHVGDSGADFLSLMGMDSQGSRHKALRKQMHALAACRVQLGFRGQTYNGQPVKTFSAWATDRGSSQRALWPGTLVLDQEYFDTLMQHAVPLDNRALMALKGSALALDVYAWLAQRLHRIEGKGVVLHWKSIREQFAQEYIGKDADKDFKKKFLPALKKVLAVYPNARVKRLEKKDGSTAPGLLLMPSPPPIPYKGGPTK
jgi:hypothetical protein